MYSVNKFISVLKNVIKISADIFNLYRIFIDTNLKYNKRIYFVGHRNWGFGHQLLELRYSKRFINNKDYMYICVRNYGNKFLHERMTNGKRNTIDFYYLFSYDIACGYIKQKNNFIDIGSSPDEYTYETLNSNNLFFAYTQLTNKRLKSIYSKYKENNYKDIPQIFTKKENSEIKKKLINIGLKEEQWFVGLHIRNSSSWSVMRNNNIRIYLNTIDYIRNIGGEVIIMGDNSNIDKNLICLEGNERDDIKLYILKKSRFLICTNSGPSNSGFIFDVPVVMTNNTLWEFFSWSHKDSIMPKMIVDKRKDELINTSTYIKLRQDNKITLEHVDENFHYIDNEPDEILDAVKQKLVEIDNDNYNPKNEQLKFRSFFDQNYYLHETFSKIDDGFYLKYKKIFEN